MCSWAVVAVSSKIASYFDDHVLSCGLTYSGHPLACAAGVACVNYYKKANILENVNKVGKVLGEKLEGTESGPRLRGRRPLHRSVLLCGAGERIKPQRRRWFPMEWIPGASWGRLSEC